MQVPVMNRKTRTQSKFGSVSKIKLLAIQAIRVETAKNPRESRLSASPSRALSRVPQTNPIWTLEVSSEARAPVRPNSTVSTGITAVAENHSQKTHMPQNASRQTDTGFEFIGRS